MTICPCCGFKFEGQLSQGCEVCGARSVGEPLPKPEHELPSYARALVLMATGILMVLVLLTQTVIALAQRIPVSFHFWSWIAAAETAAWRLKWIAIPVAILVFCGSRNIYRSMLKTPARFCGLRYARTGLVASALVPLLILVLIGVTVPERLRQRESGIVAGSQVPGYTIERALFEYRLKFGTLPAELKDLTRLPDSNGSIAAALRNVDSTAYKPSGADLAALPKKPRTLRGAVIRNASLTSATDDSPPGGLSFDKYELALPGPDKLMDTEDDLILRDGVIKKASETVRRPNTSTASSKRTVKP